MTTATAACAHPPGGHPPTYEQRLYRRLTLASAFVALGLVIPTNLPLDMSHAISLVMAVFGVGSLALCLLARRGIMYPAVLVVMHVAALDFTFVLDGGSRGSVPLFLFDGALLVTIYFRGGTRLIALGLFCLDGLALYAVDHWRPGFIIEFADPDTRFLDVSSGFVVSVVACALIASSLLHAYRAEHARLQLANAELAKSLAEVRTLRGLLSICAWCRLMRVDDGSWVPLEEYLQIKTDAALTHGICPDCRKKLAAEE